jgi:hypothetical protein
MGEFDISSANWKRCKIRIQNFFLLLVTDIFYLTNKETAKDECVITFLDNLIFFWVPSMKNIILNILKIRVQITKLLQLSLRGSVLQNKTKSPNLAFHFFYCHNINLHLGISIIVQLFFLCFLKYESFSHSVTISDTHTHYRTWK